MSFDEIQKRLRELMTGIDRNFVDPDQLAREVIRNAVDGIKTARLDEYAAEAAAAKIVSHTDYGVLAGRIAVSNLHKNTGCRFSAVTEKLHRARLIDEKHYNIVKRHAARLDAAIVHERDYTYSYFAMKTLAHSYLLKIENEVVERPQHMHLRVAIGIHGDNIDAAIETYELLSTHKATHASPTMFNAGTPHAQLSSCFLLGLQNNSIDGMFDTLKECAHISSLAGGIGVHVHDKHGGGLVSFLQLFNQTARCVSQGKRKGAISVYLEPWHAEIEDFVDCRRNTGARDLFPALWVSDLFMARVRDDENWSLMCPKECPGLSDVYGQDFEALYTTYEQKNKARKIIKARALMQRIINSQIETGTPYFCFKDAVNRKSNQQHLGVIKSSNLCTEIMQYSDPDETAVCNLASVALNKFVKHDPVPSARPYFDFEEMKKVTNAITRNLNKVIDVNVYPTRRAELSNRKHRPIGIGVQGLADAFMMLGLPYASDEAKKLNRQIFETLYYGALEASCQLAKETGQTYDTYEGSPVSRGILQFDMWAKESEVSAARVNKFMTSESIQDWDGLRRQIKLHGVRNSLLVASTAQILGNTESFEPLTSNIYVLSGAFQVVNRFLIKDLVRLGLWDRAMKNQIIANRGSVQNCKKIPTEVKRLYRDVYEIKQRDTIDMAADRGMFIDQSQSLNLYAQHPTFNTVLSMLFYAWKSGLKTGMYYLRTRASDKIMLKRTEEAAASENGRKNREAC